MNKTLLSGFFDHRFAQKAKLLLYFFMAFLVGIIQVMEDVAEGDIEFGKTLYEFFLIVIVLIIVFPLLGALFQQSWKWWKKSSFLASWKYSDAAFVVVCLTVLPLILLLLAYPTVFVDELEDVWVVWVASLIFVFIGLSIEILWFMMENRQQLEIANERLLRNQEMAKYQALMNQLNPHFLFNSLNVLSYMVYKDQRGAEQFIEELSKIYRYIIQLNETYLVPVKKEIEFIGSYMYLQKIRHQNNLTYETELSVESYQKFIPPLTLEVLVENAIKHNVIDAEKPLHIKFSSQNGHLIVENNVQPRNENEVQSTHIGLKNLSEKFQILESEPPEFFIKNARFIAKIPLLQSEI